MDAEEFAELYRTCAGDVFGYLRRRAAVDVEDLVAETFTTAWRRRREMPPPLLRRPWLFGVARTLLLAQRRTRAATAAAVREVAGRQAAATPAGDPVPESPAVHAVRDAVARLSEGDREILTLAVWEQLSSPEIAVVLGIRAGTARVRLHRARAALAGDPGLGAALAPVSASGAG